MDVPGIKVFNNEIQKKFLKKADRLSNWFRKRYKNIAEKPLYLSSEDNTYLGSIIGIKNLINSTTGIPIDIERGIAVGTIRMGYGHYRMSMALSSAANSMGYIPYWLDLLSFEGSAAARIIHDLEWLYSMASRVSQQFKLFNRLYWERATSDIAKKLSYYVRDFKMTELFTNICEAVPKKLPFVSTHPWAAQTALHAKIKNVITMIPDNWPIAFHLAEGSIHAIQTPSSYLGYRTLRNMGVKNETLNPIPEDQIKFTGHYVDHEIVKNIEKDCEKRIKRVRENKAKRILINIGGAAAEMQKCEKIVKYLYPKIRDNKVIVYVNMGDHKKRWAEFKKELAASGIEYTLHSEWEETQDFTGEAYQEDRFGLHIFLHANIFPAVYSTNLLMRGADILITKPSELSFYPIPKLFIQRVGRHEAWGAIRGAEIGDGTIETASLPHVFQTLSLMIDENDLIPFYCNNIMNNKKTGIYNGAYNVVKIAVERKKQLAVAAV